LAWSGATDISCQDLAFTAGYEFFGLQWYGECWGADTEAEYSRYGQDEDFRDGGCTNACEADPTLICGGGLFGLELDHYQYVCH
jgi:hypothetical protein